MKYIFQTGHGKGMTKIELEHVIPNLEWVDEVEDGFVVEMEKIEEPLTLQNRLGGVVRITEVLYEGPVDMPLHFESWIVSSFKKLGLSKDSKIRYGISMHPKSEKVLKKTLIGSKKALAETGYKLRFVNNQFQNLSSVLAFHEKLLAEDGAEFHLFKGEKAWYCARTLTLQDFEAYSKRDMERPLRNAKNGMFPPKLAQCLINLASPEPDSVIFDPFCGSGTVLQEAVLMGFEALGSDLVSGRVHDSTVNMDWIRKEFNMNTPYHVFQADATKLEAGQLPQKPFCIVTETWLGPPQTECPSASARQELFREMEALLEAFLQHLQSVATPGLTLVLTTAYYKEKNERYFQENVPRILARYSKIQPLSDHERPSLFYERKNQVVGREIWKVVM